jgi:hypothetical protein
VLPFDQHGRLKRVLAAGSRASPYGDLGWKGTDAEVRLVASQADNFFGMIGPNSLPGLGGLLPADSPNRTGWAIGMPATGSAQ